ncbi:FG-GAP repeat domain-containing protein [Nannocystis pusilla]|uniref:FG-GAP repeat domain-containing protein n=1 Tax=Nannocystis pusilla TaxID=889268 RepID=UPI003B77138F
MARRDASSDDTHALATGDLDGDHLLDFAAASSRRVHLFHGRADRGFDYVPSLDFEATPTAMVIVDVSGDGRDDIVVNEADEVRVLIAGDDRQFLAGPRVPVDIPARVLVPLRTGPDLPLAIAALPISRNYTEDDVPGRGCSASALTARPRPRRRSTTSSSRLRRPSTSTPTASTSCSSSAAATRPWC